jgi:hypothetical protein
MNHIELDEEATKFVVDLSEQLLKFLDQTIPSGKYTYINMCLNVLTATLFRVSDTFLPTLKDKKEFAIHIAKLLVLNYERNMRNK